MFRAILSLAASAALCPLAVAQVPNLTALKAQNAVQVSADELKQLIPGAKVVSFTPAGSRRTWTNASDGTLTASTDGRGSTGGRGRTLSAEGTWRLDEKGHWCVKIQWPGAVDDWCRYMFKADGKYYGYSSLSENAPGWEFELSH